MENWGLPRAECPEQIGLSSARLRHVTATIEADVARGLIPGAVMLVARGGRIGYAEALGWRDREAQAPMTLDAIFRIASMTKPPNGACTAALCRALVYDALTGPG